MSIQTQQLRDDLVAVIAAGRELSAEHDYTLADLYLRHVQALPPPRTGLSRLLNDPLWLRRLLAGSCLALAAMGSGLVLAHAESSGGGPQSATPSFYVSPWDRDDPGDLKLLPPHKSDPWHNWGVAPSG